MKTIENLRPIWWEVLPPFAVACGFDTGRKRWFGLQSLIYFWDLNGKWNSRWTATSSLVDRA